MKKYLFFLLSVTPLLAKSPTATPIQHLVIIFQENRPFDHYFGTYPHAQNNPGEPPFYAKKDTPTVNGLDKGLRYENQNLAQPFRLGPSQAATCNPDHHYTTLQEACNDGLMDQFVQTTGVACSDPTTVMAHFDGNTVTALWNWAQFFALSDNFCTTTICQSTIGHINLISGQAHGAIPPNASLGPLPVVVQGTLINDVDPLYDQCSTTAVKVELTGINVGNLLNAKGVTWGWFQGGFANCAATHLSPIGIPVLDYVPHHSPFQYYQSTSNPLHLSPSSVAMIGYTDQANHIYDLTDFWNAAESGNLPSVSFLKAAAYQNGHGLNSDPLFEQTFLVSTINKLQTLPEWKNMAIIIAYDDSGGWYDHQMPPIINQSQIPEDALGGTNPPLGGFQGRPGYGFRVPLLIISPWAKENFVDHTLTDQTSILRFIEDNWNLGRIDSFSFDSFAAPLTQLFDFKKRHKRQLFLDPNNGQILYSR